jgi:hypothetical protein
MLVAAKNPTNISVHPLWCLRFTDFPEFLATQTSPLHIIHIAGKIVACASSGILPKLSFKLCGFGFSTCP